MQPQDFCDRCETFLGALLTYFLSITAPYISDRPAISGAYEYMEDIFSSQRLLYRPLLVILIFTVKMERQTNQGSTELQRRNEASLFLPNAPILQFQLSTNNSTFQSGCNLVQVSVQFQAAHIAYNVFSSRLLSEIYFT